MFYQLLPLSAQYGIEVLGTGNGSYQLLFSATNVVGTHTQTSKSGVAYNGSVDEINISYDSWTGFQPFSIFLPLMLRNWPLGNNTLTVNKSGTGSGTVTSNPAGINCGSTCSYDFANDTVVTLTGAATYPSILYHWEGDCVGINRPCTFTMSSPRSVTAIFILCPRKGEGDANCDGAIDEADYNIWLRSQCHPGPGGMCGDPYMEADFNFDGNIDDSDYLIWYEHNGT